ncbi:unnamed protein product [Gordionus sp. m RMFG-2023]
MTPNNYDHFDTQVRDQVKEKMVKEKELYKSNENDSSLFKYSHFGKHDKHISDIIMNDHMLAKKSEKNNPLIIISFVVGLITGCLLAFLLTLTQVSSHRNMSSIDDNNGMVYKLQKKLQPNAIYENYFAQAPSENYSAPVTLPSDDALKEGSSVNEPTNSGDNYNKLIVDSADNEYGSNQEYSADQLFSETISDYIEPDYTYDFHLNVLQMRKRDLKNFANKMNNNDNKGDNNEELDLNPEITFGESKMLRIPRASRKRGGVEDSEDPRPPTNSRMGNIDQSISNSISRRRRKKRNLTDRRNKMSKDTQKEMNNRDDEELNSNDELIFNASKMRNPRASRKRGGVEQYEELPPTNSRTGNIDQSISNSISKKRRKKREITQFVRMENLDAPNALPPAHLTMYVEIQSGDGSHSRKRRDLPAKILAHSRNIERILVDDNIHNTKKGGNEKTQKKSKKDWKFTENNQNDNIIKNDILNVAIKRGLKPRARNPRNSSKGGFIRRKKDMKHNYKKMKIELASIKNMRKEGGDLKKPIRRGAKGVKGRSLYGLAIDLSRKGDDNFYGFRSLLKNRYKYGLPRSRVSIPKFSQPQERSSLEGVDIGNVTAGLNRTEGLKNPLENKSNISYTSPMIDTKEEDYSTVTQTRDEHKETLFAQGSTILHKLATQITTKGRDSVNNLGILSEIPITGFGSKNTQKSTESPTSSSKLLSTTIIIKNLETEQEDIPYTSINHFATNSQHPFDIDDNFKTNTSPEIEINRIEPNQVEGNFDISTINKIKSYTNVNGLEEYKSRLASTSGDIFASSSVKITAKSTEAVNTEKWTEPHSSDYHAANVDINSTSHYSQSFLEFSNPSKTPNDFELRKDNLPEYQTAEAYGSFGVSSLDGPTPSRHIYHSDLSFLDRRKSIENYLGKPENIPGSELPGARDDEDVSNIFHRYNDYLGFAEHAPKTTEDDLDKVTQGYTKLLNIQGDHSTFDTHLPMARTSKVIGKEEEKMETNKVMEEVKEFLATSPYLYYPGKKLIEGARENIDPESFMFMKKLSRSAIKSPTQSSSEIFKKFQPKSMDNEDYEAAEYFPDFDLDPDEYDGDQLREIQALSKSRANQPPYPEVTTMKKEFFEIQKCHCKGFNQEDTGVYYQCRYDPTKSKRSLMAMDCHLSELPGDILFPPNDCSKRKI